MRGNTAAWWAANTPSPVLAPREMCVETDTGRFKFGDGVTAWNMLPYADVTELAYTDTRVALEATARTTADAALSSAVTSLLGQLGVAHPVSVAATTWTVTHTLPFEPSVVCVTSAGDEFIPDTVHHASGTVTVTMNAAQAGTVYLS